MDEKQLQEKVKMLLEFGYTPGFVRNCSTEDLEGACRAVREKQERDVAARMGLTYEQYCQGKR